MHSSARFRLAMLTVVICGSCFCIATIAVRLELLAPVWVDRLWSCLQCVERNVLLVWRGMLISHSDTTLKIFVRQMVIWHAVMMRKVSLQLLPVLLWWKWCVRKFFGGRGDRIWRKSPPNRQLETKWALLQQINVWSIMEQCCSQYRLC